MARKAHVSVRPPRAHFAIKSGLAVMRVVPAESETVAVGRGVAFQRSHALHHERMGGRRDIALEFDRLPAIGDPTAHRATPSGAMITPETVNFSAPDGHSAAKYDEFSVPKRNLPLPPDERRADDVIPHRPHQGAAKTGDPPIRIVTVDHARDAD